MLWFVVPTAAHAEPLQTTLDNGLAVTVVEDDRMARVAVQHWIRAGSSADPMHRPGVAHLVEHLVVRDGGLEEAMDRLGGQLSAYTAPDYTRYTALVSAADLADALHILGGVSFREDTLLSAQRVVSEELIQRGSYTARIRAAIDAALWRTHPYAAAAAWMHVDPSTITLADCTDFITTHYQPGQTHLVIVGPIKADEALNTIAEQYGYLENKTPVPIPQYENHAKQIALGIGPSPVQISGLIWPLPPTTHPDQPLLQLALSGLPASAPRLLSGALSAGAHVSWGRAGSRLMLSGLYSALRTDERIRADLALSAEAVSGWLTQARLEAARSQLTQKTLEQRLSPMSHARWLGWSATMRGGVYSTEASVDRVQSITLADVQTVWTRWIVDADPIEVTDHVD